MIAMGSLENKAVKERINAEICRLSKCFKTLSINHKKRVLKTAQGLLKIQREQKAMITGNTGHFDFSMNSKNG